MYGCVWQLLLNRHDDDDDDEIIGVPEKFEQSLDTPTLPFYQKV